MTELSLEASKLIDVGREAFRPTDADRARVFAAVVAAPLVAGTAAIGASKFSLAGLAEFVQASRVAQVFAVATPVAAAGGLVWYTTVRPAARSSVPMETPREAAFSPPPARAPQPEQEPAPREEATPNLPAPENEQTTPPRHAASVADSSNTAGQIREEVTLLTRAQAELSRGRAQQALEALKEHAQRFPRGALSNERIATRARALCALGRKEQADAELDRVERLNPGSPYWVRAREACNGK
jgi:hypothetical protein